MKRRIVEVRVYTRHQKWLVVVRRQNRRPRNFYVHPESTQAYLLLDDVNLRNECRYGRLIITDSGWKWVAE